MQLSSSDDEHLLLMRQVYESLLERHRLIHRALCQLAHSVPSRGREQSGRVTSLSPSPAPRVRERQRRGEEEDDDVIELEPPPKPARVVLDLCSDDDGEGDVRDDDARDADWMPGDE